MKTKTGVIAAALLVLVVSVLIFYISVTVAAPPNIRVVTPLEEYLAKRSKINVQDADALITHVRWALGQNKFVKNKPVLQQLQSDLVKARARKPKTGTDDDVIDLLANRVKVFIDEMATTNNGNDTTQAVTTTMLDLREVMWIRLMEIGWRDQRAKITYKNNALDKYINSVQGKSISGWDTQHKEQIFRRLPPYAQVMEILRYRANDSELLKDIWVSSDIAMMQQFETQIWPVIRKSCGDTKCHGSHEGKAGLRFTPVRNDARVEGKYTNFAILSGFVVGNDRLIDRENTENSLLLKFGLDGNVSDKRHPKDIKPMLFKSRKDPAYKKMWAWIESLSRPLHPDYHINKEILGMKGLNLKHVPPDLGNGPE